MPQAPETAPYHQLLSTATVAAGGLFLALTSSCRSSNEDVEAILKAGLESAGLSEQAWHLGPRVHVADTGPARFVPALLDAYDADAAMETVTFADGYYRAPGNEGYEAVVEHLIGKLEAAGFDRGDPRLTLRVIETPMEKPAWTPRSAQVILHAGAAGDIILHNFQNAGDIDRTVLPLGAPSCKVTGRVCFSLGDVQPGDILVTKAPLSSTISRAEIAGASAVLSAQLQNFNEDPTGANRHMDAVLYKRLSEPSTLPVAQISPASFERIEQAASASPDGVKLSYHAVVDLDQRPMRTLEARIVGHERPDECTVSVAHIQEPGASDNASGVGGQLEAAIATSRILKAGMVPWPSRSIAFVWGDEYTQTEIWLEDTKLEPVVGISSDMMGNSPELTGSICLLERTPDPGGAMPLAPDVHTPWGAGEVTGEMVKPNGFAVVARCAMIDVALYTREPNEAGTAPEVTWQTADHPWEGGSDHDVFNAAGIPGVLIWHFTDFTYHTSLDRMNMVDGEELKRAEVVLASTLLAMADPQPEDLSRYLISLGHEMITRTSSAEEAEEPGLVAAWREWERGAAAWLRAECLRIPAEEALTTATAAERASAEAAEAFYAAQAQ